MNLAHHSMVGEDGEISKGGRDEKKGEAGIARTYPRRRNYNWFDLRGRVVQRGSCLGDGTMADDSGQALPGMGMERSLP